MTRTCRSISPRTLERHEVRTVSDLGWQGVTNGELLRRASDRFDCLVTLDKNIEFQQDVRSVDIGIVILRARSNRMVDIRDLVPALLAALDEIRSGRVLRVG